jgi:hypothetical protein
VLNFVHGAQYFHWKRILKNAANPVLKMRQHVAAFRWKRQKHAQKGPIWA